MHILYNPLTAVNKLSIDLYVAEMLKMSTQKKFSNPWGRKYIATHQ